MKSLDSLKLLFYDEYSLPVSDIRESYRDQIDLDTVIVINENDNPFDSLIVIQTKDFTFGFGKSIKRGKWSLIGLYSESEKFFKEFGLNETTTFEDIEVMFDSTNSYEVGNLNSDEQTGKFVISLNDTEEFVFFTEFSFYIKSDSLKAVSVDFLENR